MWWCETSNKNFTSANSTQKSNSSSQISSLDSVQLLALIFHMERNLCLFACILPRREHGTVMWEKAFLRTPFSCIWIMITHYHKDVLFFAATKYIEIKKLHSSTGSHADASCTEDHSLLHLFYCSLKCSQRYTHFSHTSQIAQSRLVNNPKQI